MQSVPVFPDMAAGVPGGEMLDVRIVPADGAPFRCPGKALVEPHMPMEDLKACDAVLVCDMYRPIDRLKRQDYAI